MPKKELISICTVMAVGILAIAMMIFFGKKAQGTTHDHHGHGHGAESHDHGHDHSGSQGPHGGKMLTEGEFELEVVIFEKGVPPHFRIYPYHNHKPADPKDVTMNVELERLGEKTDRFTFKPTGEFLYSEQEIEEPHSFFIKVLAEYKGEQFDWEYSQYENRLTVPPDLARKMGFETETAGPGTVISVLELPGEIALNADMVSHVTPRVAGVVLESRKNQGDMVQAGEAIAVIDSRDLGDAKSRYLVAVEREKLASYNFERIQRLWEAQTVAEKEFLTAKKSYLEEKIELAAAARKLIALGLSKQDLSNLSNEDDSTLTHFVIRAPFNGIITRKHLSQGEWIKEDQEIYVIADLSTVWVEIIVYARDTESVHLNQKATVKADSCGLEAVGTVSYVGPLVGEDTRTAKARIVIPNTDGRWRPGLFAKVELVQHNASPPMVIRNEAIQTHQNKSVVFVQYDDQYEARPVTVGRSNDKFSEILKGLVPGERYVTRNSYILKAEMGKAGMSHEH
ncbi:efflux RND transporter periplasmic adaptor subunit [Desulfomonile tiedjei]|uniref:RND family efflux transporter, MFP subunit n=1 Tax=Desulfomonile tiedjei (strain ATCC 49306 / DSM 6799 / DCB-1) TaxID=706587 RepID=I4C1G0_DESTA|nr:efflux RND transporter periplasmic adaptor subunit [Desulfomonile tiedjei]AFM23401.1 RND family efflux transporter, MFP subunit [Desulfomonile tiedjei DSM 6799]